MKERWNDNVFVVMPAAELVRNLMALTVYFVACNIFWTTPPTDHEISFLVTFGTIRFWWRMMTTFLAFYLIEWLTEKNKAYFAAFFLLPFV
jgi:hypothetical protein